MLYGFLVYKENIYLVFKNIIFVRLFRNREYNISGSIINMNYTKNI